MSFFVLYLYLMKNMLNFIYYYFKSELFNPTEGLCGSVSCIKEFLFRETEDGIEGTCEKAALKGLDLVLI